MLVQYRTSRNHGFTAFGRFQLGEGITKKESDLAADVEEQQQALQAKAAQKKEQGPQAVAEPEQPQQPAVKVWFKLALHSLYDVSIKL